MKNCSLFGLLIAAIVIALSSGCSQSQTIDSNAADSLKQATDTDGQMRNSTATGQTRSFSFNYGATINGVPEGAQVRVWFPIAKTNAQQTVGQLEAKTPGELKTNKDKKYGNSIGYFETQSDGKNQIDFNLSYDVERVEASVEDAADGLSETEKSNFLSANSLVPIDGKPQEHFQDLELPAESMAAGEAIYNLVEQHMKYDKSKKGYGEGDAAWACDSKTGNCTDFHSLFISLARGNSIPARFEIGFPLPSDKTEGSIGGYHCWAWFFVDGKGWAPVDISEADKHPELKDYYFGKLTVDRIAFSTGRDIELVPKSASESLNYFVYPHVEVDGKVWPQDKISLKFSFKNQ